MTCAYPVRLEVGGIRRRLWDDHDIWWQSLRVEDSVTTWRGVCPPGSLRATAAKQRV